MKKFLLGVLVVTFCAVAIAGNAVPAVNAYANNSIVSEPKQTGSFVVAAETNGPITVRFEMAGTARLGADYKLNLTNSFANTVVAGTNGDFFVTIPTYTNAAFVGFVLLDDPEIEPEESIVLRLLPDAGYRIGDAAVAGIRLKSNPPPWAHLDFSNQHIKQIAPFEPFTFGVAVSPAVTSVWVYVDQALLKRVTLPGTGVGDVSATWVSPPPGDHEISVVVMDSHGASIRVAQTVRVADGLVKPTAVARTLDAATIVPYTGVTTFDSSGRAAVFVEFPIPAEATNYNALLFFENWGWAVPHQLFAYAGDGVVDTDDLNASFEFVSMFERSAGTEGQVDIGGFVRERAGRNLGLRLRVDSAPNGVTQPNGTDAAHIGNLRIVLYAPGRDVPGQIRWLNFPLGNLHRSDVPVEINSRRLIWIVALERLK